MGTENTPGINPDGSVSTRPMSETLKDGRRINSITYWSFAPDTRGMAPTWKTESIRLRLESCRAMLNLHSILTEKENERVVKRLRTRAAKLGVEGPS